MSGTTEISKGILRCSSTEVNHKPKFWQCLFCLPHGEGRRHGKRTQWDEASLADLQKSRLYHSKKKWFETKRKDMNTEESKALYLGRMMLEKELNEDSEDGRSEDILR